MQKVYKSILSVIFVLSLIATGYPIKLFAQSPGGVTGANLWLDASNGATGTTNLTSWNDRTGVNTFSILGSPQTQTRKINFNNTVSFNGSTDYLAGTTNILFKNAYVVAFLDTSLTSSTIIGATTPTNSNNGYFMKAMLTTALNDMVSGDNGADGQVTFLRVLGGVGGGAKPRMTNLSVLNGQAPASSSFYLDGQSLPCQLYVTSGNMSEYTNIPMVGRSQDATVADYLKGAIAEVIMYPTNHTTADRERIQTYLAIKYGISLGSSSVTANYVNSIGTIIWTGNTLFQNDIFGIAVDNNSGLSTLQSNSVNTGSGTGIGQSGKGNIVLSAASLNNLEYILVGHTTNALTFNNINIPSSINTYKRTDRSWLIRKSSTIQPSTVNLKFCYTGLTVNASLLSSKFKLLIDADGDGNFTNATVVTPVSVNTTTSEVSFDIASTTLSDNAQFAFAYEQPAPGGVTGANLWVDANNGAFGSSNLTGWTDLTGTNTFTISGTPKTQTKKINFNNTVTFNGSSDYLSGNANILFKNAYIVAFLDTTLTPSTIIGATTPSNSNNGYFMKAMLTTTLNDMISGDNGGDGQVTFLKVPDGAGGGAKPRMTNLSVLNGQAPASSSFYLDGQSMPCELYVYPSTGGNMSEYTNIPIIGRSQAPTVPDFMKGTIAEIVMYPTNHIAADRERIQTYLAIKYGISLGTPSATVNYVNSAGTTIWAGNASLFQNDIFGIAVDNTSGLSILQSNSVNTGSGNGIGQAGKGNIVLSATSLNNLEYMLVGHNTSTLDFVNTSLPLSLGISHMRTNRVWLVRRSATVASSTVSIVFNYSGLAVPFPGLSDAFKLVIDADGDGDFSNATVVSSANVNVATSEVRFDVPVIILPNNAQFAFAASFAALPVKLVDFNGKNIKEGNKLNWTVVADDQSKQFIVQYSADGQEFKNVTTVAAVAGQTNYTWLHMVSTPGIYYYRVIGVDANGTKTYTRIIELKITGEAPMVAISPNPAHSILKVKLYQEKATTVNVQVLDGNGREVLSTKEKVATGTQQITLNVHRLAPGTYFLQVNNGQEQKAIKFVKE